jgi:hypothetical protein
MRRSSGRRPNETENRGESDRSPRASPPHRMPTLEMETEDPEHDDESEAFPLVQETTSSRSSSPIRERTRAYHHNGSLPSPLASDKTASTSKFVRWTLVVLAAATLFFLLTPQGTPQAREVEALRTPSGNSGGKTVAREPLVRFACPSSSQTTAEATRRNRDPQHASCYDDVSNKILRENFTTYLEVYRRAEFDNWGKTYEEIKAGITDWKVRMYAPTFSNPNHTYALYESALGVGLNLAMTAEILYEAAGIKGIEVYGNEYVKASVSVAQRLYKEGKLLEAYGGKLGTLCAADSTHLEHVPSNAFDLVFTGYLTPLHDPLDLSDSYPKPRDLERAYTDVCEDKANPAKVQQMQQEQEKWYREWVSEMIRIARPGAPIIVESVSLPLCEALYDWGGVSAGFWNASLPTWPVDPTSLVFQDDSLARGRYHVYFRKQRL